MEINKWKNILTDWIIHTGFFPQPSFSVLEESNLEAFFKTYRLKIQTAKITEDNVYTFLKQRFPNFSFHHFDDDGLCSADFVFVYSLLLQFGCVQCRDVHIQNACKSLGEYQQAAVANFFKQFAGVKNEGVRRGNLKKMIVDAIRTDDQVANIALSTPKKRINGSPDTPKNRLLEHNQRELNKIRIQLETERYEKGFLEIQVKEGQDQIDRLNVQQKAHINEIHELRNQLLYENDENKTPNITDKESRPEVNAMKRNLSQLEDKVANLLVETHCLEADKGTLVKKLKHSEEQIQLLFERSEEMTSLVDQLRNEVQEKTRSIVDLQETNEQLQMMLNEYKSSGNPLDLNSTSDFSFSKHSEGDSETSGNNLAKSVVDIQLKEKQLENEKLVDQIQQIEESKRAMEAEIEEFLNNNDFKMDSSLSEAIPEDRTEGLLDCLLKHFSLAIGDMDQLKVKMDEQVDALRAEKSALDADLLKLQDVIEDKTKEIETVSMDLAEAEKTVEMTRDHLQAELEDLRSNCNALQRENDNLDVENRSYQTTIKTLEEDLFIKVNELREVNIANERLKAKYTKLRYEHENSDRAVAELTDELTAQRKELEAVKGEYETLREKHTKLEKEFADRETQLKDNVASLETEMEEKRTSIKELEKTVKQLKENNSIIEEVTTCLNEEIQAKNGQIGELERQVVEAVEKLRSNEVKLAEKVKENGDLQEVLTKKDQEIQIIRGVIVQLQESEKEIKANLTTSLDESNRQTALLNQQLSNLENEINRLEDNGREAHEKIVDLESRLEKIISDSADVTSQRDKLKTEIESLDATIEKLKTQLKETEQAKENDASVFNEKVTKLGEEMDELVKHNTELEEEIKESVVMIAHLEEKLKFAADEMDKMHSLENELKQSVDEKAETIQDLFKELEAAKIEEDKRDEELNEQTQENVKKDEVINALEAELKERTEQRAELEEVVRTMNEDILNKSMNISNLEAEVVNIKDTIVELGNTITGLNEEVQEKEAIIAERDAAVAECQEKAKELELKLEESEGENLQLDEFLTEQKEEFAKKLSEIEAEKMNVTEKLHEEQQSLEALKKRCDHLMELSREDGQKIADLEAAKEDLEEQLKASEENLMTSHLELTKVQESLKNSNEIHSKLTEELAAKSELLTHHEVEIEEMKSLIEDMEKNISDLHETLIEKTTLIVGLETKMDETNVIKDIVECELAQERQIRQGKAKEVESLEGQVGKLSGQMDELKKIIAEEKAAKENFEQELSKRSVQMRELNETLASISEERQSLQEAIYGLTETALSGENHLQNVAEELEKIKKQLKSVTMANETMKGEKDKLTIQLEKEQQLKKEKSVEIEKLEETVVSLNENIFSIQEAVLKLTTNHEQLKRDLVEKEGIIVGQKEQLEQENAIKAELNAKLEKVQQESSNVKDLIAEKEARLEGLQKELDENKNVLVQKEEIINKKTEESQELQDRLKDQLEERQEIQKMVEVIQSEVKELKDTVAVKEQQLAKIESELPDLSNELMKKIEENSLQHEKLETLLQEKEEILAQIDQLKSDLDVVKTDSNQKEFNLQSELDKLNEEKRNLHENVTTLNDEAVIREERIATLTEEVENVKAQFAEKVEAFDSLVDDVEKRKMAISTLEQEKSSLQGEKDTLNNLIEKLTKENKVVELQLDECEKKLTEINEEYETVKSRHLEAVEELQKELDEVRAERRALLDTNRAHEMKLVELNAEIVEKERKVSLLMTDLHKNELGQMEESSKIHLLLNKIESYKTDEVKLQELENLHHREKEINKKLTTDVEILCAKLAKNRKETDEMEKQWKEERKELQAKVSSHQSAEDRIKDYRIEMEGKLEKMKDKMKTLYNEEMGKLKSKHERDIFEVRKEVVAKQHQVEEYDVQCRKLAKQIRQLNERQLDMYKENEFMKTRLKSMDQTPGELLRSRSHRMLPPSSSMLSVANLKMEDEEGEVFNNTYLIDLKNGGPARTTSPSRESICLSELQHRNSMAPRHLRSTYAVQYGDQGYREEDLQHSSGLGLDDSMSSLLNTGQRKKVGGTTSYKRPGPPTPSKNGGRLSFGGTGGSVVGRLSLGGTGYDALGQREALKEFNDNASNRKSITKETPGKVLGSLFSSNSSKVRNENATPKKRLSIFRNKKQ